MWIYEKKLEYPVNIRKKDLKMAKYLMSQYGGPTGELSAALQYLNQRFTMPDDKGKALLTDIGTEELGGMFAQQDSALFPSDAAGIPFTAAYINTTGDFIADLESDMAAEQRARATYEHLMDLTNDPDVLGPLAFLRQREIIHYQRFKELRNYYLEKQIQRKNS